MQVPHRLRRRADRADDAVGHARRVHRHPAGRGGRPPHPLPRRGDQRRAHERFPRIDDSEIYKGVVVASGITSAIPVLEWFIADADYNADRRPTRQPTSTARRSSPTTARSSTTSQVNIRGASTQTAPKLNWKFEMAKNHDLSLPGLVEPVDEFAMQADFSRRLARPGAAGVGHLRDGRRHVNTQMFPVRTQRNAQFQGLYMYLDLFDGTWRDREGYSDDQFFKAGARRVRRDPAARGVPVREEEPRRTATSPTSEGVPRRHRRHGHHHDATTCSPTPTSRR